MRWCLLILAATLLLLAAAGAQACRGPYMDLGMMESDFRFDASFGVDAALAGRLPDGLAPAVTVVPVVDVGVPGVPLERGPPPAPPVPLPGEAPPVPSVPPVPDPSPAVEGILEPSVPGLGGPIQDAPGAPSGGMGDAVPGGRPADAEAAAPPLDLAAGALFALPAGAMAWLRGRGRRG